MAIFSSVKSTVTASARGRRLWQPLGGVVALASLLLGGPAQSATVHDVIGLGGQFGIFAAALQQTALWDRIQQERSVTLFVPSDRALRDEGSAFLLEQVLVANSNAERLQEVLSYHVYPGLRLTPEAVRDEELSSLRGACFLLFRSGSALRIGPEAVVIDYIGAENGGVFVIDRLLWQPWEGSRHCADSGDASAPMLSRLPGRSGPSRPYGGD